MDLRPLLRRLPPQDGNLTIEYQGSRYPMPYETMTIDGETIPGVRENVSRLALLDRILTEHNVKRDSLLDIGCNLGTTANHFRQSFDAVAAIDANPLYVDLANQFHPGLEAHPLNLNEISLQEILVWRFSAVFALSMFEYIADKPRFVEGLYQATERICIVEGHSETIYPKALDGEYEALLKAMPWTVTRRPELTDNGLNAPAHCIGRPVWVCVK